MISNCINNIRSALEIFPNSDIRAKIQTRDLISKILLSMQKDNRKMSLASLRRSVISESTTYIARSSFWQRLASKRLTNNIQKFSLNLIESFRSKSLFADLEKTIGVKKIFLIDSTSITLKPNAKSIFPGPRTSSAPAVIKWHVLFDFSKMEIPWCDTSSGVKSDCCYFPRMPCMVGSLTIFDLGYYDYSRMAAMDKLGMFYLSRIKAKSNITIVKVVNGISKDYEGQFLADTDLPKNQPFIELIGDFGKYEGLLECRAIGFWNFKENKYHWYMTNLKCDSKLIYSLYKLRWQIELVFKTVKSSFCFEELCSANKNIILNLLLLRMSLAFIFFPTIALIFEELKFKESITLSVQRAGTIFRWLLPDIKILIELTTDITKTVTYCRLMKKVELFRHELADPNYRKRKSTISLCLEPLH